VKCSGVFREALSKTPCQMEKATPHLGGRQVSTAIYWSEMNKKPTGVHRHSYMALDRRTSEQISSNR
jgi:hypothetical protein